MAGTSSRKGVGLWLKLLLWAVVLLAAFFYLRSVNEKASEGKPDEGMDSKATAAAIEHVGTGAVETVPAARIQPAASSKIDVESRERPQTNVSRNEQSAPTPEEPAVAQSAAPSISPVGLAASAGTKSSPQQAEPIALATEATARAQQSESSTVAVGEPATTPPSLPAPVAEESDSAAPSGPARATEVSVPAETAPVAPSRPNEAKAQAESGAATGEQAQTQGAGKAPALRSLQAPKHSDAQAGKAVQESTVSGAIPYKPPAAGLSALPGAPTTGTQAATAGSASESFEEQQARIMAEYQALRRERWELMREYLEYMGAPGRRSVRPYGYYPRYAPGYYRPWQ